MELFSVGSRLKELVVIIGLQTAGTTILDNTGLFVKPDFLSR